MHSMLAINQYAFVDASRQMVLRGYLTVNVHRTFCVPSQQKANSYATVDI